MLIKCSRVIEFDAGHRVIGHEKKCRYLHGHRYKLEIEFGSEALDKIGRVIDFGVVKEILGKWIDDNWDHNLILSMEDKELGDNVSKYTGQKVYYLPYNPTAENMARYLIENICPKLFRHYHSKCTKIKLYETPNCFVDCDIK